MIVRPGSLRKTRHSGVLGAYAECEDCGATNHNANALGWAAQHCDKTGHTVRAEQTVGVTYNQKENSD
jgi:hypothetical protein